MSVRPWFRRPSGVARLMRYQGDPRRETPVVCISYRRRGATALDPVQNITLTKGISAKRSGGTEAARGVPTARLRHLGEVPNSEAMGEVVALGLDERLELTVEDTCREPGAIRPAAVSRRPSPGTATTTLVRRRGGIPVSSHLTLGGAA